jgi:hypothetical protein
VLAMGKSRNWLTIDEIDELFDIDLDRGEVYWKNAKYIHSRVRGRRAGYEHVGPANTYRLIHYQGVKYSEHCIIYAKFLGAWPDHMVDHANRDTLDNRIDNLRPATVSESNSNRDSRPSNSSGLKWVSRESDNRWRATVAFDGERRRETFYDPYQAHIWAKQQAQQMQGAFFNSGLILGSSV